MIRGENVHIVTKNAKFPIFYDNAASAHVVERNLCHLDFSKGSCQKLFFALNKVKTGPKRHYNGPKRAKNA